MIRRKGPWRSLEAVEFATLAWVDWFDTRRLLGPIGDIPPAEFEAQYYAQAPWPDSTIQSPKFPVRFSLRKWATHES